MFWESMRFELMTLHTSDLHAVMALLGHMVNERQNDNLIVTERIVSSM